MKKQIVIALITTLLLSSCLGPKTPNLSNGKSNNNYSSQGNSGEKSLETIGTINNAQTIENELSERTKVISTIKDKQKYIEVETANIDENVRSFLKSITGMRELISIDYKIILSIRKGLIKEKEINKDNYLYKYVANNKEAKNFILNDIEDKIDYFSKDKSILEDYLLHFEGNNNEFYTKETELTFNLINYYIKNGRYKRSIIKNLQSISKGLEKTAKEEYIYTIKGNFMGGGKDVLFNKKNINYLISKLSN